MFGGGRQSLSKSGQHVTRKGFSSIPNINELGYPDLEAPRIRKYGLHSNTRVKHVQSTANGTRGGKV